MEIQLSEPIQRDVEKLTTLNEQESEVKLAEIIAALSTALDITEGQPAGHAARSCVIAMRLAQTLRLEEGDV